MNEVSKNEVRMARTNGKGNVKWEQLGQVKMVRLGEIDNFKCDGLAMVASGKGNVKLAL